MSIAEGYHIVTDRGAIDVAAAHAYLTRSYWAKGIAINTVARSIDNSQCIAVRDASGQVGFARVISDFATFAYLADVYVLEDHQGKGLAQAMLRELQSLPMLQGLRRWALFTLDAHSLYQRLGWSHYEHPERLMLRDDANVYCQLGDGQARSA